MTRDMAIAMVARAVGAAFPDRADEIMGAAIKGYDDAAFPPPLFHPRTITVALDIAGFREERALVAQPHGREGIYPRGIAWNAARSIVGRITRPGTIGELEHALGNALANQMRVEVQQPGGWKWIEDVAVGA